MTTYTTTRGIEVEILPIPAMLIDKITAQHPDPEPPTYEVKTLGGGVEHHPLTEQAADTDEEKARYADWLKRKSEAETERNHAFMRVIMLRGIRVELPADDGWVIEQSMMGVTVPTEPTARKLHYIETEVFGGLADYESIAQLVMEASGVGEAALKQASDLFRGDVERDATGQTADQGGQVEILGKVRAGQSRRQKRVDAGAV